VLKKYPGEKKAAGVFALFMWISLVPPVYVSIVSRSRVRRTLCGVPHIRAYIFVRIAQFVEYIPRYGA